MRRNYLVKSTAGLIKAFNRSQLDLFCPLYPRVYCSIEFKLSYLKELEIVSIRVKELFEHIVLPKNGRVFALF